MRVGRARWRTWQCSDDGSSAALRLRYSSARRRFARSGSRNSGRSVPSRMSSSGWRRSSTASTRIRTARSRFSFGYSNLNREEIVEIPLGPDNFIEPKEFDGRQPTSFPPVVRTRPTAAAAARPTGAIANAACSPSRSLPVSQATWCGRSGTVGRPTAFPGGRRTAPTRCDGRWRWDRSRRCSDSRRPVRPAAVRSGIDGGPMQASVGAPLRLASRSSTTASARRSRSRSRRRARTPRRAINVTWYKHSGPGPVTFAPAKQPIAGAAGYGDDVGDLQAAGRVRDPRARRQLRPRRHVGRQPVLLDERLHEGRRETLEVRPPENRVVTYAVGPLAHAQRVWRATT